MFVANIQQNVFKKNVFVKIHNTLSLIDKYKKDFTIMASQITKQDLQELTTKFSIRNFLTDLPRMLNDAFTVIYKAFLSFYDPDSDTISSDKANIGYLKATTIVAKNLTFTNEVGEEIDYHDLISQIQTLKERVDRITNITKQQIDTLNAAIYPTQTISVGQTAQLDTRITTGTIVYQSYDDGVVTVNQAGSITGQGEGFTYVSVSNTVDSEIVYIRVIPTIQ